MKLIFKFTIILNQNKQSYCFAHFIIKVLQEHISYYLCVHSDTVAGVGYMSWCKSQSTERPIKDL